MTQDHLEPATNGNGTVLPPLPAADAAIVQSGMARFQATAAERDALLREVIDLKTDIATRNVECEALRSRIAEMESRVQTAVLVRDQAVAERAIYEALFISFQAQLRAFKIPAAPLVVANEEAEAPEDII